MQHAIYITIDGSDLGVVYHPNDRAAIEDLDQTGVLRQRHAGGHVWPQNPVLRGAFRLLRAVFGRGGRIADWTRGWSCAWIVVDSHTDERLTNTFTSHQAAVDFEIHWLKENYVHSS